MEVSGTPVEQVEIDRSICKEDIRRHPSVELKRDFKAGTFMAAVSGRGGTWAVFRAHPPAVSDHAPA